MREIEVKILRGAETDNRRYQTYTVSVEEDAAVSVMNLLEEIINRTILWLSSPMPHAARRHAENAW